ncbi:MAG: hypothetical protein FI684_06095, partial [SAR202 cluster bacterium]|nr:hypothetical protein [SAR202 cluster bacterium]
MTIKKIVSVDPSRFKLNEVNPDEFKLIGYTCNTCDIFIFGPATNCQKCTNSDVTPVDFSGDAILHSYTLIKVAPAGWIGATPYILAEAELSEGPHVLAEIIGVDFDDLSVG